MIRTCIIDLAAGVVVNVVEYETAMSGTPPGMDNGFLAIPSSIGQIGWTWDGDLHPPAEDVKSPQQVVDELIMEIQQRLDDFARQRNYDSILSACTYATSTVAKFKAEGQACVNLRDATWSAAYDILAQVQAGTRPVPQSIADIEADLPVLAWPA